MRTAVRSEEVEDVAEIVEPWTCSACKGLMYNIDLEGKPIPGAPTATFYSSVYPKLCRMCLGMIEVATLFNPGEGF